MRKPWRQFHLIQLSIFLLMILTPVVATGQPQVLNRPNAGTNNVWYQFNDSETVFVFVHGILSDSRTAWFYEDKNDSANSRYWPEMVSGDKTFEKPSIFLGGYYTEIQSGSYDIRDAANDLFEALAIPVDGGDLAVLHKKNIVFITHSTGGIVVRHMLTRHVQDFRDKKVGLVLIASPSGGSKDADRFGWLAKLVDHEMGKELQWDNPFLTELDKDFKNLVDQRLIPSLAGIELLENHFILKWLSIVKKEVVSRESAGRYFGEPRLLANTDHISAVKPDGPRHPAHMRLRSFYTLRYKGMRGPVCDAPPHFKLRFTVSSNPHAPLPPISTYSSPFPNLLFNRITGFDHDIVPLPHLSGGRFGTVIDPPFPCPGDRFQGSFAHAPSPNNPVLDESRAKLTTEMCFVRSRRNANERHAELVCREGEKCTIHDADPGLAEECTEQSFWDDLQIVGRAKAQASPAATYGKRWIVPSLETLWSLPTRERPGFTEFRLASGPLPSLKGASHFTQGVTVNGTQVLVDGFPSHDIRTRFNAGEGLFFAFALQNLDFAGGDDGYERITVEFNFYNRGDLMKRARITRQYISYRHAEPTQHELGDLGTVEWRGTYHPGAVRDTHEIMLTSSKRLLDLTAFRTRFERENLEFKGLPLVTVIRPPLPPNPHGGVTLALRHPNKQVEASFPKAKAERICRWLLNRRAEFVEARGIQRAQRIIQDDIYLYEFHRFSPDEPVSVQKRRMKWKACRYL